MPEEHRLPQGEPPLPEDLRKLPGLPEAGLGLRKEAFSRSTRGVGLGLLLPAPGPLRELGKGPPPRRMATASSLRSPAARSRW